MEKLDLNSLKEISEDDYKHEGIVSKISDDKITVSLKGNINCEGCKAQSACGVSESNDKEIELFNKNYSFELNDSVNVVLQKSLGLKAVFFAYIFPFILLIVVLISTIIFFKEWVAGLISLFVLIPYYMTLYFLKTKFQKVFKVSIFKIY